MTWNRREKMQALVVGGVLAAAAGWFLVFGGDSRSAVQLRAMRTRLEAEVAAKQNLLDAADRDAKRLAALRRRALPSDRGLAASLYQNWLRALANRTHFSQPIIKAKEGASHPKVYTCISFSLQGHVGLADLTQFLYDFYSTGHLHKISVLSIMPVANSRELDVNMTIEALSLPDADRKDQLSKEAGPPLRLAKSGDYRELIAKRDLFTPYSAPRAMSGRGEADAAQFAFVTGFTEVDGARQVWIQDRMAGKTWQLNEGQDFQVGRLHGTVRTIAPSGEVVVDFDGHRRRLRDGENLRGGVEVAEQGKAPEKDGKSPETPDAKAGG